MSMSMYQLCPVKLTTCVYQNLLVLIELLVFLKLARQRGEKLVPACHSVAEKG